MIRISRLHFKPIWSALLAFFLLDAPVYVLPADQPIGIFFAQARYQDNFIARRVNAPYTSAKETIPVPERAIFWFGRVTPTENYADGRVIYNDNAIFITLHIFDNRLWYDVSPNEEDLTKWDAATLYLDLNGNVGDVPNPSSYKFTAQLRKPDQNGNYQSAYRGKDGAWIVAPLSFETRAGWRGGGLNDGSYSNGWNIRYAIPFSSLGLPSAPSVGTVWGFSAAVHDRDDSVGSPISDKVWPENSVAHSPGSWGQIRFGIPNYNSPTAFLTDKITIRQGLNGVQVVDGHVGGHTTCGEGLSPFFENWGNANYAGYSQINIQNQWDVSDWPCFSKYYIKFPLGSLPPGKVVISASLTMHQFGNAGLGEDPGPQPSYIQVLTIAEDWNESTLTWNNAPLALENITGTWVDPVDSYPGWPGVKREWDVSRAVAQAYAAAEPLRLALYSADSAQHSGKYFNSSDTGEWGADRRPTLVVLLGDVFEPAAWLYLPLTIR